MTITEKAAYLRGLVEGQGLDPEAGEGKLWFVLSELVSDLAAEVKQLGNDQENLADSVEEVQVGMDYLEELLQDDYDDYEDLDEEEDDYYPFGDGKLHVVDEEDVDEEEDGDYDDFNGDVPLVEDDNDSVYYEVECPNCGEEIRFDDQTLEEGSITCPNCGAALEFDLTDTDDFDSQKDEADAETDAPPET